MLSNTVELVNIFWGLYYWLDQNPTETVLVSVKVDNGNNTAALQQQIYNLMNGPEVSDYWVHNTTLPTLGAARHKLIPVFRLYLNPDNIPNFRPFGINVPFGWRDNNPSFSIDYAYDWNGNVLQTVFIEDLYNLETSSGSNTGEAAVRRKVEVLTAHLNSSAATGFEQNRNKWYIGFASGYSGILTTPEQLATGISIPPSPGVNALLLPYLRANRAAYFGVILFDFIGSDQRLINATLGWETSWGASTIHLAHFALFVPLLVFVTLFVNS
ncbi:hypothetical protein FRC17_009685 [Serendipita sp. 399]|nr:hypothetical protein FRC17_009685 [Serendipita sp. 399]